MNEFKFNIGDIVKHKASGNFRSTYAIIMGRGIFHKSCGSCKMYLLSTEVFSGGYALEEELTLLTEKEKELL